MKKCTTTIKGRSKKVLDQFEFDNDLQGISRFIRRVRLRGYEPAIALFESTGNYWKVLHGELKKTAIKPVLVNPYDLKIITQAKFKDDNRDSERMSDLARGDLYKPSYVPTEKEMDLRELVRTRLDLRYGATGHKNHVHAILAKYPLRRPAGLYTAKGREWLRMAHVRDYDRMALDSHLAILDVIERRISLLEKEICRIAVSDPRALLLMTMPGVGPVTAVTILAEIGDDLARFAKPEQLTSYAGLVPSHRNSADTFRSGGITKRGSRHLRNAAVEAAFVAVQHDPHRKQRYERLSARRGPQKALVAAARELLEDCWYMLTRKEPYNHPNQTMTDRKMADARRLANRDIQGAPGRSGSGAFRRP